MKRITPIHGTVAIEVEPEDRHDEELVEVLMDVRIINRQDTLYGADFETSDPYIRLANGTRLKPFLTPLEIGRLEDKAKDFANGVYE